MSTVDHDVNIPRDRVVGGALMQTDPQRPFVVIAYDLEGKPYVASTHGGPTVDRLLDKAKLAILEKA